MFDDLFSSRARHAAPKSTPVTIQAAAVRSSAEVLEVLLAESARRLPDPPKPVIDEAARASDPTPRDPSRPLKVLLAEDHPVNRKVVELILGAMPVDLTCVENGAQAVEAFAVQAFDLVLMDMQMPVMDGLTAIREIRAREVATGAARTPILSLTANAMPEHVEQSFAAGADDHLTKPVSAPMLIATIEAVTAGQSPAQRRRA